MRLRVATYNVHRCVGRDGRTDPSRVLQVLRALDADVIALQELEWNPKHALHVLADFAKQLGYTHVPGPTLLDGRGHYGNALLTRLPVRALREYDLSFGRREPRGALDVSLGTAAHTVRIIATHLGLRPAERRAQMKILLDLLRTSAHRTTILMGDLNEWFLWGRPLRWLHRHFGRTPAPATFPARLPLFALDRIWVLPQEHLLHLAVHLAQPAVVASDHLPVVADIRL